MKANFKISEQDETKKIEQPVDNENKKNLTNEEFEDFVVKAGAAGSFMVFRSDKNKDDELGLDEL
jgi:hypothetical protein